MFTLYPKSPSLGWKPWASPAVIERGDTIPTLSDSEFISVIVNRSKLGRDVHGGDMVNSFIKYQIDPEQGDAIVLFMYPFEEWHTIISNYTEEDINAEEEDKT